MNWRRELKNYGIFLVVGLPLLLPLILIWATITEIAGYIALAMIPVYITVHTYRWITERVRA